MEKLITYFETIPSTHRSAILVGGIALFWLLEGAFPLFRFSYNKWRHAGLNIFFTLTTIVVNFALAFVLVKASDWAVARGVGVLQWLPQLPLWAFTLVGLLLLDLVGAWCIHWTEHKVKWMWRFHLIHHTDTHVDTTTANRHHPGESVFRFAFTTLAVVLAGAPMWLVFLYQALSVALSQFNHANITLPERLDRVLSWVLVTPNMHHVHHHYVQPYTDSNYGNIFSIWDRLFGTFRRLDADQLTYGIDTHQLPEEHSHMGSLLKIPFQKYRPPVGAASLDSERSTTRRSG
ncbi:sterol desaturase/sphingolipid hydroxylase (fatty acid hydroxylase superfamily) [Rhabdobacter roseus]|uniref:Sterol desaturase/sphingolipid hydroxylase (Fatty acid hydroxylase superfamily) n=1 Tax=Rhabdobacter roseus TaxID=1655419 RepID=A0A840U0S9_9BACT|nr:sterol desaturase family protein [Rhabdobacter roseus]MBB5287502.1 sterol desaturase/sphingolipid hydroxylase (fatty acid hydroxylase superfamily) [Rhabdobacter roseus]